MHSSINLVKCRHRSSDIEAANIPSCGPVLGTASRPDDCAGLTEVDFLREGDVSVCVPLAVGAIMGERGLEYCTSRLGCTSRFTWLDVEWEQRMTFFCVSDGGDPSTLHTDDLCVVSCKDNGIFW